MAIFSRIEVYNRLLDRGIMPIFFNKNTETVIKIADASIEGGLDILEMTNRGDFAIDTFKKLAKHVKKKHPSAILGCGTITDASTAALFIASGAEFIVSPVLDTETALLCNKRKIPYIPGCGTVSEIQKAHELGVEIVKLFPAKEIGGAGFVKNILGPLPRTTILATGGVSPSEDSLNEWFSAGIAIAGMGSKLFPKELIEQNDFETIKENIRQVVKIMKKVRK